MTKLYNEDCMLTMMRGFKCDMILTSPPYNTSRNINSERARANHETRYDGYKEQSADEYLNWVVSLFEMFDVVLKSNGVVAWNVSYGGDGTQDKSKRGLLWNVIAEIQKQTSFVAVEDIIWKKPSAFPINVGNKLTRVCEHVFIFARKEEYNTYHINKRLTKTDSRGQKYYEPIWNFIEAKSNDGANPYNKATFSTDFASQMLKLYCPVEGVVYDPFMGTGTTAVACKNLNLSSIGSEISADQCKYAEERLND